jgi:hypothetical protein
MKALPFVLAIALLTIVAPQVESQGAGRGKGKSNERAGEVVGIRGSGTDVEIRIIRDYYAVRSHRQKPLPPGIAKNLVRGKPLPPGIARTRVPDDLLVLLPARTGARWLVAGNVAVLVGSRDVVVDIVRLGF